MSININVVVEMEFLDIEEPKMIVKHLGNLLEDESYSDFKFVFPDGRSLRAHKVILAGRWKFKLFLLKVSNNYGTLISNSSQ